MTFKAFAAPLVLFLAGCGEMGTDPEGPFKAYLMLQDAEGAVHDFYLGGYSSLEKCVGLLEFEAKTYEREQGRAFYTNTEVNYGGFKSGDLHVEHLIVGAKCREAI